MTTWTAETDDASAWVGQSAATGDSYVENEYVARDYIEADVWTELEQVMTWQSL